MSEIGYHGTCEICGQRGKIWFYGSKRLCRFHHERELDYLQKSDTPRKYQEFKTLIQATGKTAERTLKSD